MAPPGQHSASCLRASSGPSSSETLAQTLGPEQGGYSLHGPPGCPQEVLALGVSQSDRDRGPSAPHPFSIVPLIPSPLPALGRHGAPCCPWIRLSWRRQVHGIL